jgi:hypothetical protein
MGSFTPMHFITFTLVMHMVLPGIFTRIEQPT